jgi:hypothetical protein
MPLVIQFHDGLSCPTIVCDAYQEPITDARAGGYFFPRVAREEGRTVPSFYLHKGACDRAYTGQHGWLEWWGELWELPTLLAGNPHVAPPGDATPWCYGHPQKQESADV